MYRPKTNTRKCLSEWYSQNLLENEISMAKTIKLM
uniref:Uncharacterized protein n=1 Tax=Arundo donax TaxID=35708 RepID=A0A0A9HVI1_ARUDO